MSTTETLPEPISAPPGSGLRGDPSKMYRPLSVMDSDPDAQPPRRSDPPRRKTASGMPWWAYAILLLLAILVVGATSFCISYYDIL